MIVRSLLIGALVLVPAALTDDEAVKIGASRLPKPAHLTNSELSRNNRYCV